MQLGYIRGERLVARKGGAAGAGRRGKGVKEGALALAQHGAKRLSPPPLLSCQRKGKEKGKEREKFPYCCFSAAFIGDGVILQAFGDVRLDKKRAGQLVLFVAALAGRGSPLHERMVFVVW